MSRGPVPIDPARVRQLLFDLVALDSVNPSLVPGGGGEKQIGDYLYHYFGRLGLETTRQEVAPGRANIIARLAGSGGGRSLLLNGHMDTVGVEGMSEPFTPREQDGKVFGRGAQDTKGGIAAGLAALEALVESDARLKGDLLFCAVVDEEYASIGTEALVRSVRADAAVVFEPTDLQLVIGHKGFVWFEVETQGRAAHGSLPEVGIDAILNAAHFLAAYTQAQPARGDPLLGAGSFHASRVEGGREWSTYPDRCRLQLEQRTLPGETPDDVLARVEQTLAALAQQDARFAGSCRRVFARAPFSISREAPIVQALARAIAGTTGRPAAFAGFSAWTDAALLAEAGIPAVVFGPGGAGLHGVSEYVKLDEVCACAQAMVELALDWCSGAP